jgi:putative hemolysin
MGIGLAVFLLLAGILLSVFFSSLETAASLCGPRVKKLLKERSKPSRAIDLWLAQPHQILSSILLGSRLANFFTILMATTTAQRIFANSLATSASFFLAIMVLVFSEMLAKDMARNHAENIIALGMPIILPIYGLFWPVSWLMNGIFARLLPKWSRTSPSSSVTVDEITYMIEMSEKEGILKRGDGHLFPGVIKFRETVAKESMVPRTEIGAFEVDISFEQILAAVIKEGHTRWPVYENNIDNIIGIFHVKDLMRHVNKVDHSFSLRNFLRPVKFVPDMMKIGHLLKEFQAGKAHLAVVVDEYGGTAGIISLEDVLEEIVGEIRDEYDDEEYERTIQQIDSNNYLASGKAKIFELGKELNITFPDSDAFDSLGGFLIALHGCMPNVGTKIMFGDCSFLIKTADEKKIIDVHIHRPGQVKKALFDHARDQAVFIS